MNSKIMIKEHWLASGRENEIKQLIEDKILLINDMQQHLYSLRDSENELINKIDLLTREIKQIEGIIFDFIPEEKQVKDINNKVNILIKGLDNTKL